MYIHLSFRLSAVHSVVALSLIALHSLPIANCHSLPPQKAAAAQQGRQGASTANRGGTQPGKPQLSSTAQLLLAKLTQGLRGGGGAAGAGVGAGADGAEDGSDEEGDYYFSEGEA